MADNNGFIDTLRKKLMSTKGDKLGSAIKDIIESSSTTRAEAVAAIASAAGISASTVNQIISGSIICPPKNRLRQIAKGLKVPYKRLKDAAEADGCMYDDD